MLFRSYVFAFIVVFFVFKTPMEHLLSQNLGDPMLFAPLSAAYGLIEFMATMGAATFLEFIMSFFVGTWLSTLMRVYGGPILLRRLMFWFDKWTYLVKRFLRPHFPLVSHFFVDDHVPVIAPMAVEDLMGDVLGYSVNSIAANLSPFLIGFIIIFQQELYINQLYGIRDSDLVFYLVFSVVISPTRILFDLFIHNVLELVHGWKLFYYFKACRSRYHERATLWKGHESFVNIAIDPSFRLLDRYCFSSQYYFVVSLFAWGLIHIVLSVEMLVRADGYVIFADPALLLLVPMAFSVCIIVQGVLTLAIIFSRVWRPGGLFGRRKSSKRKITDTEALAREEAAARAIVTGGKYRWEGSAEADKFEKERAAAQLSSRKEQDDEFRHAEFKSGRGWLLRHLWGGSDMEEDVVDDWPLIEIPPATKRIAWKWLAIVRARNGGPTAPEELDMSRIASLFKPRLFEEVYISSDEDDDAANLDARQISTPSRVIARRIGLRWKRKAIGKGATETIQDVDIMNGNIAKWFPQRAPNHLPTIPVHNNVLPQNSAFSAIPLQTMERSEDEGRVLKPDPISLHMEHTAMQEGRQPFPLPPIQQLPQQFLRADSFKQAVRTFPDIADLDDFESEGEDIDDSGSEFSLDLDTVSNFQQWH